MIKKVTLVIFRNIQVTWSVMDYVVSESMVYENQVIL
jgi:hypothetical protein